MTRFIHIATTTATREEAERIASELVQCRLAACVQVNGPVTSSYWWKGALEQSQEWRCDIKTRADLFDKVAATIRKTHSYEVPEIIASEIAAVSEGYHRWLEEQLPGDVV